MVKDPVCGKDVDDVKIDGGEERSVAGAPMTDPSFGTKSFHDGRWFYFCSMACRQRFIAAPARYLQQGEEA